MSDKAAFRTYPLGSHGQRDLFAVGLAVALLLRGDLFAVGLSVALPLRRGLFAVGLSVALPTLSPAGGAAPANALPVIVTDWPSANLAAGSGC